ncbi:MAG: DNA methyltransferase [Anaerolineales bacterium]|jgi:DNA modification methylase
MPLLSWPTKTLPDLDPADLMLDSVVYPSACGYPDVKADSHLFLGENLRIMAALLPEYESQLDLIYADPPFFTNKRYSARIGRGEDSRRPQDWQMAEGYGDHWENLDGYLDFLYPRLAMMYRLLAPNGTLYLHLDWHANAYARILLDEIFGREHLLNEIIWTYHGPSPIRRAFNRKHDAILVYTKGDDYTFNADAVREPYHPNTVKTFASSSKAGFGKIPDLERGKVPEDWWYFPVVARLHNERTGYPTQKPEALIERILLASSNPGDLVADFFCGSGTFPVTAARHERRFLAADISWRAIHTTRERVIESLRKPFSLSRETSALIPTNSFDCRIIVSNLTISLIDPPALDYWEVDPAWDGKIFRSVFQARRSNRSAEISLEIKMPAAPTNVCVRAVTVDGSVIQSHIQPVSNAPDRF